MIKYNVKVDVNLKDYKNYAFTVTHQSWKSK